MYLCNHVALALGLEGSPDPTLEEVTARVVGLDYKGYVCPEYHKVFPETPAEPPAKASAGGGGATTPSAKAARR